MAFVREQPLFKEPFIDDNGCIHWFAYAPDEVLAIAAWPLDKTILGLFKEWCKNHNYEIGEGALFKHRQEDSDQTEFEVVAPLMENA